MLMRTICRTVSKPHAPITTLPQAYTYVGIWIGLSGVVIMYNKYLLAYGGFPYPITLTMWWVPDCAGGRAFSPTVASPRLHCTLTRVAKAAPPPACADLGAQSRCPLGRHMFFCAALAIGLVKSGKVQAISMDRETYVR